MKFGIRIPSIKKRISARISPARFVRHRLGIKVPKGLGFVADPKKFIYNKIYNKTSISAEKLIPGEGKSVKMNFFLIIFSAIKSLFNKKQ
jgi:hypothetical protein